MIRWNARSRSETGPAVSIVVVTHNALRYVLGLLRSLPRTRGVAYELVVVDNRSRPITRAVLAAAALLGRIQRLCLLNENTLFAAGNNIGASATSRAARYVLLLNSDVEVRDPDWLVRLIDLHRGGATSFGYVEEPFPRADGYCLLIDRALMLELGLDEEFAWYWSITKLQAQLLQGGHPVRAVRDHDHLLYHFGGRSGRRSLTQRAKGMDIDRDVVRGWFTTGTVELIERT
jgi:GT2 family glycosyltransferase